MTDVVNVISYQYADQHLIITDLNAASKSKK